MSSGVTVALRLAGFEARSGPGMMGPDHLLLALSWISDRSMPDRFEDPDKRQELADEGEKLRERFAEAGIDPDELRGALRTALARAQAEPPPDGVPVNMALMRTIRRAGELGAGNHAGVIELLRAILEQPMPRCREVFELLGVDEPLYAFFPEIPRPAAEPGLPADADRDLDDFDRGRERDPQAERDAALDELSVTGPEHPRRIPRRARHAGDRPRTPLLDRYGRRLSLLAREGALPPLVGREQEMLSLARVLIRQRKANAVLVGEAGVGKTGIVEGLAARLAAGGAPKELADVEIVELTMSAMVAGTKYRGEFEERMEAVLKEARETPGLILFLDELHTVLGAGGTSGSADAASILKPMLARGEIRVIGATTAAEYQRYVEEDPALQRRFAVIWVEEPTRAEAVEILEGVAGDLERHHRIEIAEEAPAAAVELAIRYLPEQHLPDKAIDLLDQACAAARIPLLAPASAEAGAAPAKVGRPELVAVVAERARIPVERVAMQEAQRLLGLEEHLSRRVIGQHAAVAAVSEAVRAARAGLGDPRRPIGVFLLAGPTGSGKTELAKALAEFLFDDERRLIRIDMSEYQDKYTVSRLLGAPPGYLGHDREGQLSGPLRAHPHSVVLFDEVEKAHPEVLDLFLQIFDEGRLTDARGRRISFTETVVLLTTNLGYERGTPGGMGFRQGGEAVPVPTAGPARIMAELRRTLRPELLGRVGEVVVFEPLAREALEAVLDRLLARVHDRLADRSLSLELDGSARELLLKPGSDAGSGARALERAVERELVQPLGRALLGSAFPDGTVLRVTASNGELEFAEEP
ncbi:ATP-dependent Clp protease ATP-binding subunit [Actinospica sp. MGRD01-02]|uniref:ATP-dependent Clp protease ATP-binding subunit n=1 Tax=Actinospica acidithermotolerans TaxID=2828514 RepID=A0A941ILC6_9ACTN|nr:ATP-dependent Clp protease ATP-binding subunit [Actinospica acidithermotolerans]MBR7829872.1 ATP-dependent Clp protease ATP-binding subunit [Actinospica acidithermotolerans]